MTGIGTHLRNLRLRKGISIQEVAAFLNVDPGLPRKIENGIIYPAKNHLFQLAGWFGVNENELLIACQAERINKEAGAVNRTAQKRLENLRQEFSLLRKKPVQVKTYKPSVPLQQVIESFQYCSNHSLDCTFETVIPDGSVQLVIELGEGERQLLTSHGKHLYSMKKAWISGIQKQPVTYRAGGDDASLYIRFRPGGFYALSGIPQSDLENTPVEAEALIGSSVMQLREQLISCKDASEMFSIIEDYFTMKFNQVGRIDPLVGFINRNRNTPLSTLTRKSGYSHKHFICNFKKQTGFTPKYYQRIRRFSDVLNYIQTTTGKVDWAAVAYEHGYYDQAHFIKEFRNFTGTNPREYMESGSTCTRMIFSDAPFW